MELKSLYPLVCPINLDIKLFLNGYPIKIFKKSISFQRGE